MDNAQAKSVLVTMQAKFDEDGLRSRRGSQDYFAVHKKDGLVTLEGIFTTDELEAIVMYMRGPEGVCNAEI